MSEVRNYTVKGMTCEHCVASVSEEVQEIPGVEHVAVELQSGALTVTTNRAVDDDAVRTAVQDAGYQLA